MTTSFYAPPEAFQGPYVVLPEEESAHAVRVLRHRPGDEIVVVDGEGGWYRVRLDRVERRKAAGVVLETRREVGEAGIEVCVGLAVLKQRNRFETFLEKAVELGVREVIPLLTERTEKAGINRQRAENMVIAAMKQCGRSRLLRLGEPQRLSHVLDAPAADVVFLAHEQCNEEQGLLRALPRYPSARSFLVLIGPEGGFSEEEVGAAQGAGFETVSLGPRRLRAETAALVAATALMLAAT